MTRKKRRAEDQLSPYNEDVFETPDYPDTEATAQTTTGFPLRRARARRNKEGVPADKESLKGLFGTVSLNAATNKSAPTTKPRTDDLVAGLNRSFLKAMTHVIEKQANKDMSFLLKQYRTFIDEIRSNEQQAD